LAKVTLSCTVREEEEEEEEKPLVWAANTH